MASHKQARKKFAKLHRKNGTAPAVPSYSIKANTIQHSEILMDKYAHFITLPKRYIMLSHDQHVKEVSDYLKDHRYLLLQLAEQLVAYRLELAVHQDTAYARKQVVEAKLIWDCASANSTSAKYLRIPDSIIDRAAECIITTQHRANIECGNSYYQQTIYTNSLICVKLLSFLNCVFD